MSKIGTFFHGIKSFFEKLFGSAHLGRTISGTIKIAAPLVESIVEMTAGEGASNEIKSIVNEVQGDLAAAATLATSVTAEPDSANLVKVETILNGVKSNLGAILSAGHIKNAATVDKVTNVVNLVTGEIEAILSELPTAAALAPATPVPAAG
jgi:hypothetical protein